MGRCARLCGVRAVVPAGHGRADDGPGAAGRDRDLHGGVELRAPDGRGLPGAERVDAGAGDGAQAAGDGVAARRRLSRRFGVAGRSTTAPTWRATTTWSCRRQPPSQRPRLPRPVAARRRVRRLGQRRHARHRRRARMGARQHRAVRRRSHERHDLRRVRRWQQGRLPARHAVGARSVPPRASARAARCSRRTPTTPRATTPTRCSSNSASAPTSRRSASSTPRRSCRHRVAISGSGLAGRCGLRPDTLPQPAAASRRRGARGIRH